MVGPGCAAWCDRHERTPVLDDAGKVAAALALLQEHMVWSVTPATLAGGGCPLPCHEARAAVGSRLGTVFGAGGSGAPGASRTDHRGRGRQDCRADVGGVRAQRRGLQGGRPGPRHLGTDPRSSRQGTRGGTGGSRLPQGRRGVAGGTGRQAEGGRGGGHRRTHSSGDGVAAGGEKAGGPAPGVRAPLACGG